MKYFTAFVLFITILSYAWTKSMPSYIKKCKLTTTEDVGKCILERIKELKPRFSKGLPELKMPVLEPLFIPKMEIHSEIGLHAVFTNISVHGLLNAQIIDIGYDFEKHVISVHFLMPESQFDAICSFETEGPALTFSSSGVFHVNMTNVDAEGTRKFSTVKKNGNTYIQMGGEHDQKIKYGKANVYFEKLFGDNEELTQRINQLLNENIDELSKSIVPLVEESFVTVVTEIIQNFWNKYSLEEAFD